MFRLRDLLNIRPGEGRMASLVVGIMLLTSAGFTLGSTGVEALFFARFGVQYLPYMYMGLGALSFLTSLGITALLGRVHREKLYIFIPIAIALLTVIAWATLFSRLNAVYPVLWLGKEVVNSLTSLVIWGIAGAVCDMRQSKRLFPLFNAGRILGAVLGGLGTGALVSFIGTQNLLLAWAGMLLLAFVLIRTLLRNRIISEPLPRPTRRRKQQPALVQEMQKGYQFVRGSALMRLISVAAVLFSILYFSIALPFSKSATAQYPDENALAGFLGLFNGLSTAAAFLASVFLANRLYARFGIMNAILALPVIYLVGFGGLALSGAFLVVVTFRFAQILWLSGIADSAYQAMFNAVPIERRDQVRAFIGGVPEQAGTFIAGAILLIGEQAFSSQQLAIVGLMAAIATTFIIWRAGRAYNQALVASLRAGHPTIFTQDNRLGLQQDATAIHVALDGLASPDPLVRCIAVEILGSYGSPAAVNTLVKALQDENADVRLAALKGLASPDASPALLEIAALLNDPRPALRAQAVDTLRALTPYPHGLGILLQPMLSDPDSLVHVRAAVALLSHDPQHPVRGMLRQLSMIGEVDERVLALNALAEVSDPDALTIFATELADEGAPSAVRCAAAAALATCGARAIPALKTSLAVEDPSLRRGAASALGRIGETALPAVLDALAEPASEQGALLALEQLPAWKESARVREYAKRRIAASIRYEDYRLSIRSTDNERVRLLAESLQTRARHDSINALKALSLLNDRETLVVAIDNLQSKAVGQRANALESLEAIRDAALIRPLLRVWEPLETDKPALSAQDVFAALREDEDNWLRTCAAFASVSFPTDTPMDTLTTLSIMERVLLLRRVSLLADLTPADLQRVAAIVTEHHFADEDLICEQGEPGEEMYVIVSGEVRVLVSIDGRPEKEIARRKAGEVVGEMSIISGEPRNATVAAVGDVRMLRLDRVSFESLLRERPEVSLAVMRVLCQRLNQLMQ